MIAYIPPDDDNYKLFFILFASWVLCALFAAAVGSVGKRTGLGFALGVFLGPLGILIAALVAIGSRNNAPAQPTVVYLPHPSSTARTTGPQQNAMQNLPEHLTIARDGELLGTWPLSDVMDYLAEGSLLPTDQYLQGNLWLPLRRIA